MTELRIRMFDCVFDQYSYYRSTRGTGTFLYQQINVRSRLIPSLASLGKLLHSCSIIIPQLCWGIFSSHLIRSVTVYTLKLEYSNICICFLFICTFSLTPTELFALTIASKHDPDLNYGTYLTSALFTHWKMAADCSFVYSQETLEGWVCINKNKSIKNKNGVC